MDTRSKYIRSDCLRKTMKPGSKLRWKLPRVFTKEDEALTRCGAGGLRTIRKYLGREQRRPQLAKLAKFLGDIGKKEKKEARSTWEVRPSTACHDRLPSGAMAPENTTQYLMGNVYEDMTADVQAVPVSHETSPDMCSASFPAMVFDPQDPDCDGCLAFQQRDFEEVFDLYWQPE
ncbi:hypothetical protein EYF80_054375 [Liparis tanakae]|uniref:Uncharacterized protein n=1 Tax=Liparis tanakae TaxID=230148 RepID=A0A4Z2F2V4_9TELE|nr:hypothetical protein EYF80_054375 [Liparis tanakae]